MPELLELLSSCLFVVWVLVWMVFQRQFSVRLFDHIVICSLGYSKQLAKFDGLFFSFYLQPFFFCPSVLLLLRLCSGTAILLPLLSDPLLRLPRKPDAQVFFSLLLHEAFDSRWKMGLQPRCSASIVSRLASNLVGPDLPSGGEDNLGGLVFSDQLFCLLGCLTKIKSCRRHWACLSTLLRHSRGINFVDDFVV